MPIWKYDAEIDSGNRVTIWMPRRLPNLCIYMLNNSSGIHTKPPLSLFPRSPPVKLDPNGSVFLTMKMAFAPEPRANRLQVSTVIRNQLAVRCPLGISRTPGSRPICPRCISSQIRVARSSRFLVPAFFPSRSIADVQRHRSSRERGPQRPLPRAKSKKHECAVDSYSCSRMR